MKRFLWRVTVSIVCAASILTPASSQTVNPAASAEQALEDGDWQSAISGYEKLVKASPTNAAYRTKLGVALYSALRPGDAVTQLRQSIKLNATSAEARIYLGLSLAQVGQCPESLTYLSKADTRRMSADLQKEVGTLGIRCAMSINRQDEALAFLSGLRRALPNDPEVLFLSVHVFSDLSIRSSQELLYKAPASYQVHELNAEALEAQGRWDDALSEYRAVLEKNPNVSGIHYRIGRLLLSKPNSSGSFDEAKKEFQAELKTNPNNAGAEYILAEIARQQEQWPEAVDHFGRATQLDSGFADAFIGLGRSLMGSGQDSKAIAPLEHAIQLQPPNPTGHYYLAIALRRSGKKEAADREFAAYKEASGRANEMKHSVQEGVLGPQQVNPQEQ